MGAGLDSRFAAFHDARADGIVAVREELDLDLAPMLRPDADPEVLRDPVISLLSVFVTEVALARQYMSLGAFPDCLVGHSLGEYAAALLSGVLSLADAVRLVGVRAELMGRAGQNAAMMTVALGESRARQADRAGPLAGSSQCVR